MPLRCHQCGGKFGLVRRTHLTFSGYLHFCTKKCLNAHKGQIRKAPAKRFLRWLPCRSLYRAPVSFPAVSDQQFIRDNLTNVRSAGGN
jgi:hypothetical protein